jgi:Transposase DDE domain group 1
LLAWLRLLALDGDLARAEPKTLRYRILHAAGRLTCSGRRRRLKISAAWPWAPVIVTAWTGSPPSPKPPDQHQDHPSDQERQTWARGAPATRPASRAPVIPRA